MHLEYLGRNLSNYLSVNKNDQFIVPRALAKAGDIKTHSSVRPSFCHKNFNLADIFKSINGRALILTMHDPCDKPFQLAPCCDLNLDLWPFSRSNFLPRGGPKFSEFACFEFSAVNYSQFYVQKASNSVRLLNKIENYTYFDRSLCLEIIQDVWRYCVLMLWGVGEWSIWKLCLQWVVVRVIFVVPAKQSITQGSLCPSSVCLSHFAFADATCILLNTGW